MHTPGRTTNDERRTTITVLRRKGSPDSNDSSRQSPGDAPVLDESDDKERIVCRRCGQVITSGSRRISVSGSHEHTFANPGGMLFQIGCFSTVRGCIFVGQPTEEWSWFAGYRWQVTYCAECSNHLGWFFTGGDHGFHGLVLKNLRIAP